MSAAKIILFDIYSLKQPELEFSAPAVLISTAVVDMKIQNPLQTRFQLLIASYQPVQFLRDPFRFGSFGGMAFGRALAEGSCSDLISPVCISPVDQVPVDIPDVIQIKRSHHGVQNMGTGGNVVDDFDDIVHLYIFKIVPELAGTVDVSHLCPRQTVACHPAGTVGHVDSDILINPEMIVPDLLIGELSDEGGKRYFFSVGGSGALCTFRNQPAVFCLNSITNFTVSAISSNHFSGNIPFGRNFFNRQIFQKSSVLSCQN